MSDWGALTWSERGETGEVRLSKPFLDSHYVFQLDALRDWKADLEFLYHYMLDGEKGKDLPTVYAALQKRNAEGDYTTQPRPDPDEVAIPKWALDAAITSIEFSLEEVGGCDHSVGLCMCADKRALHALKLARGDTDAIEAEAEDAKRTAAAMGDET